MPEGRETVPTMDIEELARLASRTGATDLDTSNCHTGWC